MGVNRSTATLLAGSVNEQVLLESQEAAGAGLLTGGAAIAIAALALWAEGLTALIARIPSDDQRGSTASDLG